MLAEDVAEFAGVTGDEETHAAFELARGRDVFVLVPPEPVGRSHHIEELARIDLPDGLAGGILRLQANRIQPGNGLAEPQTIMRVYLFDAANVAAIGGKRPPLNTADASFRCSIDEEVSDLVFDLPETLPESIVLYAYLDRNNRAAIRVQSVEFISAACHIHLFRDERGHRILSQTTDLSKRWWQQGNRLWLRWLERDFFVDMPATFELGRVPKAHLELAEMLLFDQLEMLRFGLPSRMYSDAFKDFEGVVDREEIEPGRTLLCFSAGEDSTAALALLPEDTVCIYLRRAYSAYKTASGAHVELGQRDFERAAIRQAAGQVELHEVPTDFETIGLSVGLRHGFRDGIGYALVPVLLAEAFDANIVALGATLDLSMMSGGHSWKDSFNKVDTGYSRRLNAFAAAGLIMSWPVGMLSEVATHAVCAAVRDRFTAVPCPDVSPEGQACGKCYKCFRKSGFAGVMPAPGPFARKKLSKRPLDMAMSTVYGAQKVGYSGEGMDEYADVDLEFIERYHRRGLVYFLPRGLRDSVARKLSEFGVLPMSDEDEEKLRGLCLHIGASGAKPRKRHPERRPTKL